MAGNKPYRPSQGGFFIKIFKYEVPIQDSIIIDLPVDSKILSFQIQNGKPYIWALVDPDELLVSRYFTIIPTGAEIEYLSEILVYIGTVQMACGAMIFHLFEDIT